MNYTEDEYYYKRRHRKKLYRSNNGLIFGVCQGLANYTGISVGTIRFLAILTFILSGFAPIGIIYLLLAVFMPTRY